MPRLIAIMIIFSCLNSLYGNERPSNKIKFALIDSFYCSKSYYEQKYPGIDIHYPFTEKTSVLNCDQKQSALHGHYVLENIIEGLDNYKNFQIYLFNVFNQDGIQQAPLWKKSAAFIKDNRIPFTFSATGYFQDDQIKNLELSGHVFLSAGHIGKGITKQTILYPQSNAKYFLIGSYIELLASQKFGQKKPLSETKRHQVLFDPLNMHEDSIDFLMKARGKINHLSGSSFSLTQAASLVLNHCHPSSLGKCLESRSEKLTLKNKRKKREFLTLRTK